MKLGLHFLCEYIQSYFDLEKLQANILDIWRFSIRLYWYGYFVSELPHYWCQYLYLMSVDFVLNEPFVDVYVVSIFIFFFLFSSKEICPPLACLRHNDSTVLFIPSLLLLHSNKENIITVNYEGIYRLITFSAFWHLLFLFTCIPSIVCLGF